jgi:putative oxidoreductase
MNPCGLIKRYGPLAARVLIAQLFVVAGLGKLMAFAKTAAFMANKGIPLPEVLLVATIALELGGSILLVVGWKARWIAAALFGFTLIATLVFHPFWAVEPQVAKDELNNFMKNLAIMGAMLYIMAYGPGPFSLGKDDCADDAAAPPGKKKKR